MDRLTFKEYLKSKEQLKKIAEDTAPLRVVEYKVKKYCKIVLGEQAQKLFVPLKPKSKILIEWLYANAKSPAPVSIKLEDLNTEYPDIEFETPWKSDRLIKWLLRNTMEQD